MVPRSVGMLRQRTLPARSELWGLTMHFRDREPDEDERREAIDQRRARSRSGCWCRLDGFPGSCLGPAACPYSGYHDEDEDGEDNSDE